MESDESKLSHPVSYVYLTNNGLWKNRVNPGVVPSLSYWKKTCSSGRVSSPALRIAGVTSCTAGKPELGELPCSNTTAAGQEV